MAHMLDSIFLIRIDLMQTIKKKKTKKRGIKKHRPAVGPPTSPFQTLLLQQSWKGPEGTHSHTSGPEPPGAGAGPAGGKGAQLSSLGMWVTAVPASGCLPRYSGPGAAYSGTRPGEACPRGCHGNAAP